jgi:hypothetical protein
MMKKANDAQLIADLVYSLNEYSVDNNEPVQAIKLTKFLKKYKQFSANSFEKLGGYKSFIKAHFRTDEKNLKVIQSLKRHNSYVSQLERQVGDMDAYHEKLVTDVSQVLSDMKLESNPLDATVTKKYLDSLQVTASDTEPRSVVTIWSDHHFGTNFKGRELGGKNEFNWVVGARRLAMLCEQIATYKVEKRKQHQELVVLLMGDNIGGVIHNQEGPTYDLSIYQIVGTTYYYRQAFDYLKTFFPKIRVFCQAGNHGRVMHKSSKDRALQNKEDSFEHMIFSALSQAYATDPKVEIIAPHAPFCDATIQGHRVYATHGDTVFETGNVGKVVALEKIEVQVNKINADEISKGKAPYEMFCTGHVHHPLFTQVGPGISVAINGCLIGLDAFAHSVKIHSSTAVQLVWESTKKYAQGDTRKIFVDRADEHARFDKIIKPYDYHLVMPKLA